MTMYKENVLAAMKSLKQMAPPFEGGCLCGNVRYRCDESPFWSSNCHCASCQKLGGGASATAFTLRTKKFTLLSGDTLRFERRAESGHGVTTTRCRDCGTWVYAERTGQPEWRSVLAATLDDPASFVLISEVYVSAAQPWSTLNPDLLHFQKMPEDEVSA